MNQIETNNFSYIEKIDKKSATIISFNIIRDYLLLNDNIFTENDIENIGQQLMACDEENKYHFDLFLYKTLGEYKYILMNKLFRLARSVERNKKSIFYPYVDLFKNKIFNLMLTNTMNLAEDLSELTDDGFMERKKLIIENLYENYCQWKKGSIKENFLCLDFGEKIQTVYKDVSIQNYKYFFNEESNIE